MKAKDLMEAVGSNDLKWITDSIFGMAEENAYDAAEAEQRGVSGDDIFHEAKTILQAVESAITDRLHKSINQ